MTSAGYNRMLELVAENPAQEAEELVAMAADEGYDAADARSWLQDALDNTDVLERDEKFWVVRKGEYAFGEYDHPVS